MGAISAGMFLFCLFLASTLQAEGKPLFGKKLYVRQTQASEWILRHKVGEFDAALGRKVAESDIDAVRKIAKEPQALWITGRGDLELAEEIVDRAQARQELPVFVLYAIPGRDNGNYSRGGEADFAAYESLAADFARIIGKTGAVVIVEPDALGLASNISQSARTARFAAMRFVVAALARDPNCFVYIEVAQWLSPDEAATRLDAAGIDQADGFSINTSGYDSLDRCLEFGRRVSRLLDGKHFVIDTSRNGKGAWRSGAEDAWCNPPGRALGPAPTTETGLPFVDAFLWIKPPGESDGECRGGAPAGTFMPARAIDLARHAR